MSDFLRAHQSDKPTWGLAITKALYDPYRDRFWFLATFNNAYPGNGQMFGPWQFLAREIRPRAGAFVLPAHRRNDQRYTNSDFPMIGMDKEAFYVSVAVEVGNPIGKATRTIYASAANRRSGCHKKRYRANGRANRLVRSANAQAHDRWIAHAGDPTWSWRGSSGMKFAMAFDVTAGIWALRNPFGNHPEIRGWTVPDNSIGPATGGVKVHRKEPLTLCPSPSAERSSALLNPGTSWLSFRGM